MAPPWPRHGPAIEAFEAPLPSGWSEHLDPEGRVYFFSQVGMVEVAGVPDMKPLMKPLAHLFLRWSTVVASFGLLDLKLIRKSCSRPGYKPISPCTIWADWTVLSMSWPLEGYAAEQLVSSDGATEGGVRGGFRQTKTVDFIVFSSCFFWWSSFGWPSHLKTG